MGRFSHKSTFNVPVEELFTWHERPGAFERMVPPWERIRVIERSGTVRDGDFVRFRVRQGPWSLAWTARHEGFQAGREFRDRQVQGPFRHWLHHHRFEAAGGNGSTLEDLLDYRLPLEPISSWLVGRSLRRSLSRAFEFRHRRLRQDLARHAGTQGALEIAVTGSSGLIGTQLVPFLTTGGHRVIRLVRSRGTRRGGTDPTPTESDHAVWDPRAGLEDRDALEGVDAVVHLAGESIASGRWTEERKRAIRQSRVAGTRHLCESLANLERKPQVLVTASAIGYYGDRGEEELDESGGSGDSYLSRVAEEWEDATEPARESGIRVVNLRIGLVLSARGGALGQMLLPFKLGLGGKLGSGRQWMSWIHVDDLVGIIHWAICTDAVSGPVNAVAPHPVRNSEFTETLGRVLGRPAVMGVPSFALRLVLGREMAEQLLLTSAKVVPRVLLERGFEFFQESLSAALSWETGRHASDL